MMFATRKRIRRAVDEYLAAREQPYCISPPEGFNPGAQIKGLVSQWLVLPWHGKPFCAELRVLNAGEHPRAGYIEWLRKNNNGEKPDAKQAAEMINMQETYCKAAFKNPSYAKLEELVLGADGRQKTLREAYAALKARAENEPLTDADKAELEQLAFSAGVFLPPDTMAAVAMWCACYGQQDIWNVNKIDAAEAYILSKKFHKPPHEFVRGNFLDVARNEFDIAAELAYKELYGRNEHETGRAVKRR